MKMQVQGSRAVILGAARTPFGAFLGALSEVSATELGIAAAQAAMLRAGVKAHAVQAVVFGNVLPTSKDGAYLARHVGLRSGAPVAAPALAVNRACASGLEAVVQSARLVASGEAKVVLAGGAENMSQAPYAMRGVRKGWRMVQSQVDDMLFSALYDPEAGCSIGETVEKLAVRLGISRGEADAAAQLGQQRAVQAAASGVLAQQIVPVSVPQGRGKQLLVQIDEAPRPGSTPEALAALPGLFQKEGVVTAGNSTGLNDGAAAVVIASDHAAAELDARALGELVSWASVGVEPLDMALGPVDAIARALRIAELDLSEMATIELNDAFAAQSIAVLQALRLPWDDSRVNPNGGAIALGHPMGATGVRLVQSALQTLEQRGGGYGMVAMCAGGGQGMAAIVKV